MDTQASMTSIYFLKLGCYYAVHAMVVLTPLSTASATALLRRRKQHLVNDMNNTVYTLDINSGDRGTAINRS